MNTESTEKWNAITHIFGIIFGLFAFPFLLYKNYLSESYTPIIASIVYGLSFLFLFASSSIYHSVHNNKSKEIWRKIDHISIYFMISGTYVPFMLEYINTNTAILFLSIMYGIVLIGTVFKLFFFNRFERVSVLLYLFLGWMIVFIAKSFFENASILVSTLVILGGIAYTSGVYFYVKDKKYDHTIWHIFVLIGSILHFQAVYYI